MYIWIIWYMDILIISYYIMLYFNIYSLERKKIFVLHSLKKTIHRLNLTTFALLHLCRVLWTVGVTHSHCVYYRNKKVFLPPALRVIDKPSHERVTAEQHSSSLCINSVTPCHSPFFFSKFCLWKSVWLSRELQSNVSRVLLILGEKCLAMFWEISKGI